LFGTGTFEQHQTTSSSQFIVKTQALYLKPNKYLKLWCHPWSKED